MDKIYLKCGRKEEFTTSTAVLMASCGTVTTILNSIQIWFMKNKVPSNNLSPFLYSLAIADLLTGVSTIFVCTGRHIGENVEAGHLACLVLADGTEMVVWRTTAVVSRL